MHEQRLKAEKTKKAGFFVGRAFMHKPNDRALNSLKYPQA
jgi:hypothetical protein